MRGFVYGFVDVWIWLEGFEAVFIFTIIKDGDNLEGGKDGYCGLFR